MSSVCSVAECPPHPRAHRFRRILVADDDDDFRALVADVLRRRGYVVETVRDGYEFARFLDAVTEDDGELPDAVVSDVRMPGHSGIELLGMVRAAGWSSPVILVSGFADDELCHRALDGAAFAVLQKPCTMESLARAVDLATRDVDE